MGMYNEVFKSCPKCGRLCEIQIRQIVIGFGEFNLDDLGSLAEEYDEEQLTDLHEALLEETFYCNKTGKGCGNEFSPFAIWDPEEDEN